MDLVSPMLKKNCFHFRYKLLEISEPSQKQRASATLISICPVENQTCWETGSEKKHLYVETQMYEIVGQ